jgi:hypothetical protein
VVVFHQIAHLEKLRTDRLNWAAAVFQKNWKRIIAERRFRAMRTAAVKIQTRTCTRALHTLPLRLHSFHSAYFYVNFYTGARMYLILYIYLLFCVVRRASVPGQEGAPQAQASACRSARPKGARPPAFIVFRERERDSACVRACGLDVNTKHKHETKTKQIFRMQRVRREYRKTRAAALTFQRGTVIIIISRMLTLLWGFAHS